MTLPPNNSTSNPENTVQWALYILMATGNFCCQIKKDCVPILDFAS